MGTCWSCGAPVGGLHYMFTCPACAENSLMKDIRKGIRDGADGQERAMGIIASGIGNVADKLSGISDEISNLAGIVQGGFDELKWELQQQTQVLLSIDRTLKTPSQTQAREWREMAEQLRSRGTFDEAEQWFLKSLEMSPLDFRTYVGLAMTYLRKNNFDKAEELLTRSLTHAPQKFRQKPPPVTLEERAQWTKEDTAALLAPLGKGGEERVRKLEFDCKSLPHRLIGRIWACRGDYGRAAAELQAALEFSPDYPEGNYDYALYCVQSGEAGRWEEPLRRAISARPGYLNVATVEPRFAPVRQELTRVLSGLLDEANRNARQALQEAERKFAEAKCAVAEAPPAEGSYGPAAKEITTLLVTAKSDLASKDYSRILKVLDDVGRAATLSDSLAKDARDSAIRFSQEKKWWQLWK